MLSTSPSGMPLPVTGQRCPVQLLPISWWTHRFARLYPGPTTAPDANETIVPLSPATIKVELRDRLRARIAMATTMRGQAQLGELSALAAMDTRQLLYARQTAYDGHGFSILYRSAGRGVTYCTRFSWACEDTPERHRRVAAAASAQVAGGHRTAHYTTLDQAVPAAPVGQLASALNAVDDAYWHAQEHSMASEFEPGPEAWPYLAVCHAHGYTAASAQLALRMVTTDRWLSFGPLAHAMHVLHDLVMAERDARDRPPHGPGRRRRRATIASRAARQRQEG